MIYLDSAAIVKLVRRERHTDDLVAWLGDRVDEPLVASALVEVEVPRAIRRAAPAAASALPTILARLHRVEIDRHIRAIAAAFQESSLRSLDAIHLATAQYLSAQPDAAFEAFVTYDQRLIAQANAAGLPTACPGVTRPSGD